MAIVACAMHVMTAGGSVLELADGDVSGSLRLAGSVVLVVFAVIHVSGPGLARLLAG